MQKILADLRQAAARKYGQERARELGKRLEDVARWLWLVEQEPFHLLDEEPDDGR